MSTRRKVPIYGVYVKNTNTCLGAWYVKIVADRKAEKAARVAPGVEYEVRAESTYIDL